VLETICIDKQDDGEPAFVPCRFDVVSLWYRQDPDVGGQHRAQVCVLSPELTPLIHIPVDVDLRIAQRARTRCVVNGLLVRRPGMYYVTVELRGALAREVARVPLEVSLARRDRTPRPVLSGPRALA
jgi:hypothetical protein